MLLAALGADVIKVEQAATGGDLARQVGPHRLGPNDSQYFQAFNLDKRSVTLDIKSPAGKRQLEALARDAEAVVNNLRGDLSARLGLDYATLGRINPAVVCLHISAYGRDNERADWPGYDYLMQAEVGLMSLTGEPDGPPARVGASMVDYPHRAHRHGRPAELRDAGAPDWHAAAMSTPVCSMSPCTSSPTRRSGT